MECWIWCEMIFAMENVHEILCISKINQKFSIGNRMKGKNHKKRTESWTRLNIYIWISIKRYLFIHEAAPLNVLGKFSSTFFLRERRGLCVLVVSWWKFVSHFKILVCLHIKSKNVSFYDAIKWVEFIWKLRNFFCLISNGTKLLPHAILLTLNAPHVHIAVGHILRFERFLGAENVIWIRREMRILKRSF